ncbi:MAG: hypothetical protein OXG15_05245 [Gammaproteobacteria bacterium]|nr:hypothetical protein [Gammaproteobacteria bacterium]
MYWQLRVARDKSEISFSFVRFFLASETNRGVGRIYLAGLCPLVAIVLSLFTWEVHAQSAGVAQDRAALVALYEATDGPNWVYKTNWLSDAPMSEWYGVNTDVAGRVVSVYLKGRAGGFGRGVTTHGLSGQLPPELGDLSELTTLILGINNLSGPIPAELGNLTRLTQLNLDDNNLTGEIPPELGNLSRLTSLRIANNQLTGQIPTEIGNLELLVALDLSGNRISGQIPNELGHLTRLTILLLGENFLIGELPDELGRLTELRRIELDGNSFSGPLPEWIGNFKELTYFSAYDNNFSGEIPATIGNLTNLTDLVLGWNFLSGALPNEINQLSELEYLDISRNELTGRINPELTKLTNLWYLNLSDNNLVGPVISGLRRMPSLQILYLSNNNFAGPLPTRFVDARTILLFSISGNQVCVPGTHSFIFWLERVLIHDIYSLSFCNATDRSLLERLFEDTNGESWANTNGWGEDEVALERWYGIDTDALGRVVSMDLSSNGLEGKIPLDLGYLTQLRSLNLEDNQLVGRLPLSLRRLALRDFQFADTELCVPLELEFQSWLDDSGDYSGTGLSCEPLTEREVMVMFFEETEGDSWAESTNWLSSTPIEEWHGVEVNGDGNVTALRINANGLSGTIPLELARLTELKTLDLEWNFLSGSIPPELGEMTNLTSLNLGFNDLQGSIPVELGNLTELAYLELSFNSLSGSIPHELGGLVNLEYLGLTGNLLAGTIPSEIGNLSSLSNLLLSYNQLHGSIPPELSNLNGLITLSLQGNGLSGRIPPELGNLPNLNSLWLNNNDFTGEIPKQIGHLTNLQTLSLQFNRLSGEIPREFGNLSQLQRAELGYNRFEGDIPHELGNLRRLRALLLSGNRLSGVIPSELGYLSELEELHLQDNDLRGAIPSELGNLVELTTLELNDNNLIGHLPRTLGNLTELESLYLHENNLSGSIPSEFGELIQLRYLTLSGNSGLSGAIPIALTALRQIEVLLTVGTDICLPTETAFGEWLVRVYQRRIRSCESRGPLLAFLTQPVQSHDFPVPLIANKRALLRVFPINADEASQTIPEAQARFYLDDQEVHLVNIPSRVLAAPTPANPGNLGSSTNVEIPGSVIRSGLKLVIEVDSEAAADADSDSTAQAATSTRIPVEVHELPAFELTLIPFVRENSTNRRIVELVNEMAANPQTHPMFQETRTLLPIAELDVKAHEPVTTSNDEAYALLVETSVIRAVEGGTGYYMGMMSDIEGPILGVAFVSGRDSFSRPLSDTIAHELGHNLSLRHAPCGGPAGVDASFPYSNGTVGTWGYDFRGSGSVVQPSTPDLMSYCDPIWVSDYHFSNAYRYRLFLAHQEESAVVAAQQSLLVWGGQNADGKLVLNPSFIVHAPPRLPESDGEFEITGRRSSGDEMFSLSFDMQVVADSEQHKSFVFVIPLELDWEPELDAVSLSSTDGSIAVDVGGSKSMSMLRNPITRQIRGILSAPRKDASADAEAIVERASQRGLEVLFSRGSPEASDLNP